MSLRRTLATFLLLPLFVFLERGAWYGSRAILVLFRTASPDEGGLGMDFTEVASSEATLRLLVPVLVVLAGALGGAIGPQSLLVLGALLAVPGMALLGVPSPTVAALAGLLMLLGHSLTLPGVTASAAAALRGRAEHLRTAIMALVYAGLNLGAVIGSYTTAEIQSAAGFQPAFLVCAAALLLALLCAAVLGGATLWTRAEVAAKPEPRPPTLGPLLGAGALGAMVILPWLCSLQVYELAMQVPEQYPLPGFLEAIWYQVNPAVCTITGLLIALAAGGMHLAKLRLPALFPIAGGMVLLALGLALMLFPVAPGGVWFALAGQVLTALGEATVMIWVSSRMLGDLHWRLVAPVAGLWVAATWLGSSFLTGLGSLVGVPWWSQAVGWVGVASGLLVAVVLAVAAIPARRALWSPRT
jgi:hypothetical protein